MSELAVGRDSYNAIRWKMLTSASAAVLTAYVSSAAVAKAEDADRPTVWIELGGQFEQIATSQEVFSPPIFTPQPSFTDINPALVQKPLASSFGAEGKITVHPEESDWVFSAGVRYGRSNGQKHLHQSTTPQPAPKYVNSQFVGNLLTRNAPKFVDEVSKKTEDYEILDFQAGRDVGLGFLGSRGQSTINLGVRFAQFHSGMRTMLGLDPNNGTYQYLTFGSLYVKRPTSNPHVFLAELRSDRSFRGLGPSLSWNGSAPLVRNSDDVEFDIDLGVNASMLFGRQKASVHHQTTAYSHPGGVVYQSLVYRHAPPDLVRSRSATVPNLGGFAGMSLRFPNAKISLGYRGDFFFGAMDGGIDTRSSEDMSFYGPFATISIGLGG